MEKSKVILKKTGATVVAMLTCVASVFGVLLSGAGTAYAGGSGSTDTGGGGNDGGYSYVAWAIKDATDTNGWGSAVTDVRSSSDFDLNIDSMKNATKAAGFSGDPQEDSKLITAYRLAVEDCYNNWLRRHDTIEGCNPRLVVVGFTHGIDDNGNKKFVAQTNKVKKSWEKTWNNHSLVQGDIQRCTYVNKGLNWRGQNYSLTTNMDAYSDQHFFFDGSWKSLNTVTTDYFHDGLHAVVVVLDDEQPLFYGGVTVTKESSNPAASKNNDDYSLEGAEYTLYTDKECTTPATYDHEYSSSKCDHEHEQGDPIVLTTDKDGHACANDVLTGKYYLKETTAPYGYDLDENVYEFDVEIGKYTQAVNNSKSSSPSYGAASVDPLKFGHISVNKKSANTAISDGNRCYSLEGAEYTVYDSDGNVADTLVTDANGYARSKDLLAGEYTIRETKASKGYGLADCSEQAGGEAHSFDLKPGDEQSFTCEEPPENDPPDALAWKVDDETKDATPSGKATLKGAEFTVYYFDQENLTEDECKARVAKGKGTDGYTRHWVLKTDEDGYTSFIHAKTEHDKYVVDDSDGWYTDSKGRYVLPVGTVYVVETKAPKGYNLGTVKTTKAVQYIQWQSDGKGLETVNTYNEPTEEDPTVGDSVKRGNVHWDKKDANTGKSMANIPFVIQSDTTGEWHVVLSDSNGIVDTDDVKHSTNTNAYDEAVTKNADGTFTVDQDKLNELVEKYDYEVGYWFTGRSDKTTEANDERAALVYDTYTITELRAEGNEERSLVVNNIDVRIDGQKIDKGTIDDTQPVITTDAYDPIDNDQNIGEYNSVQVNDLVTLTDVVEGTTYKVVGELHYADSGEPVKGADGKTITQTKEVKATGKTASTTIDFTVNTEGKAGTTYVVYEYLYDWDGTQIAKHEDKDDSDQQVKVVPPSVATVLTSALDGSKNVIKNGTVTVSDNVTYSNLVVGKEYTVSGTLHSKNDDGTDAGELKDAKGNSITASKTFTAETANGSILLDFTFDASGMDDGAQVVAFEDLYAGKTKVATHADITDTNQTVTVKEPNIGTVAVDGDDGDKKIVIDAEATIVDTVKYENLVKGQKYNIKGELHIKKTDENGNIVDAGALKDENGNVVTAETGEFTCENPNGTINVTFNFAAAGILDENTTLVAYETLYNGDSVIVEHHDIEDADQAVTMVRPRIETEATDGHDGDKVVIRDSDVTIVDTISYHNLVEGKTYKAYGQLYVKKQGGRWVATVDGEKFGEGYEVTTNSDGTEYWYYTDDEQLNRVRLFQKTDAATSSTDWYIEFIQGAGSELLSEDGETTGGAVKTTTIKLDADEVSISQTDETDIYADKLLDAEGNEVKAETEFVAENTDGTVTVTFTFDGSKVPAGTRVVAFESMTENDVEIAVHADIEDEDQSTDIVEPKMGTVATDTLDGDKVVIADSETSVTDTVDYENLLTGETYTLAGILMDTETGLPIMTGEGATKYSEDDLKQFIEDAKTALTATEEAKSEENSDSASDKDEAAEDAASKVEELAAKVADALTDSETKFGEDTPFKVYGSQVSAFEAKYVDMMSYMVIQTKEFTPEKSTDSTTMEFKFNANDVIDRLSGETKTTVVYELLFKGSLADAKDEKSETTTVTLEDTECEQDNEPQTVTLTPTKISTELKDKSDGDHEVLNSSTATVVDTVTYEGLIPGKEYTLKATLMDKSTGKELLVNDQTVTAELKFTPNSQNGSVDIEVGPFDASALNGKTVVCFEELHKQVEVDGEITDTIVAEHKDIDDENQAVTITDKPGDKSSESGKDSTSGQDSATLKTAESIAALIAAIAMVGAAGLLAAKKLRKGGAEE